MEYPAPFRRTARSAGTLRERAMAIFSNVQILMVDLIGTILDLGGGLTLTSPNGFPEEVLVEQG
jgi:hypothetical protein